jgi:hypothetical protein
LYFRQSHFFRQQQRSKGINKHADGFNPSSQDKIYTLRSSPANDPNATDKPVTFDDGFIPNTW